MFDGWSSTVLVNGGRPVYSFLRQYISAIWNIPSAFLESLAIRRQLTSIRIDVVDLNARSRRPSYVFLQCDSRNIVWNGIARSKIFVAQAWSCHSSFQRR